MSSRHLAMTDFCDVGFCIPLGQKPNAGGCWYLGI